MVPRVLGHVTRHGDRLGGRRHVPRVERRGHRGRSEARAGREVMRVMGMRWVMVVLLLLLLLVVVVVLVTRGRTLWPGRRLAGGLRGAGRVGRSQ